MSPELGAALIGLILACTSLVKQVSDKVKMSKQSDENSVKTNEKIAILETKLKIMEDNSGKNDIRFQNFESELKSMNSNLNQLIGMLKGKNLC